MRALEILVERVIEQHRTHPTRILVRRTRKGKFSYREVVSRKQMGTLSVKAIAEKLLKLVRKMKNYTHLVIKPIRKGGTIYQKIKTAFTLL